MPQEDSCRTGRNSPLRRAWCSRKSGGTGSSLVPKILPPLGIKIDPIAAIVNLWKLRETLPRESKAGVVLTGGCFDILHIGHVRFLSEAKAMGDYLVVLLESDEKVKELKGTCRTVFSQKERAEMLSAPGSVNLVVLLPTMDSDSDYLDLVMDIKTDIIAVTENDPNIKNKRRQAKEIGG